MKNLDWYPGKPLTELEELKILVQNLRYENSLLKKQLSDQSWITSPDRMGGSFTREEREDAYAWR